MAKLSAQEQAKIKATANAMAEVAQVETMRHFRVSGLVADNKEQDSFDPVTIADRAAEKAMRAVLAKMRPDDAILGEEYGFQAGTSGLTWVLDPIDGTRGYISGTPTWGVLISVRDADGPFYGIIVQPHIGEQFIGGLGEAQLVSRNNVKPLLTSKNTDLGNATMLSTFPEIGSEIERAAFTDLARDVRLVRYGMDCYGYALLALGCVDLVVEAGLQSYDVQAPIAVVQAAGGVVTDWQGKPAHDGGRMLAAANADIHQSALEILRKASEN